MTRRGVRVQFLQMLRWAMVLALTPACFNPSIGNGVVPCGTDAVCPPEFACAVDGYCYHPGTGPETLDVTLVPITIGTITSGTGCTVTDSAVSCSGISGDSGYSRTVDSAFAACTEITGSGSISARVIDFNKVTGNYPKAGVGFMSDAVGTGPMVAQMIFPEGTNGLDAEYRTANSAAGLQTGITTSQSIPTIATVDYDATTSTATLSYDQGSGAVTNATVSVALPDLKYACVFLSSRGESLSASFDQVSVQ